jgi:hypothetical protein
MGIKVIINWWVGTLTYGVVIFWLVEFDLYTRLN